jgi:hypothetical protein
MSREIRRVPLDFDFPIGQTWTGYLTPDELITAKCEQCDGSGSSPYARYLNGRWYGYVPFNPAETGSTPLTPDTPEVRAFAERNVAHSPEYYGTSELAIQREARRLCGLWNGMWSHHLRQEDVDVLLAKDRLRDLTHRWVRGEGWQPIEPAPVITAELVNRWSLVGFGHDSLNCWAVVGATLDREGVKHTCDYCDGHGGIEKYPGQRADAEAWTETPPPTGEGYQLWQTVSEGGPNSPVFATPEELADWIVEHGSKFDGNGTPRDDLVRWITDEGSSAGSFAFVDGKEISGVELAATAGGAS